MINIFLADDHQVLNQSLAQLLDADERFHVVGSATNGRSAIEGIVEHTPDIALIDYSMPQHNGIEILEACLTQGIDCHYALLTMHEEPLIAIEALKAGAAGFILKNTDFSTLADALVDINNDKIYISPSFKDSLNQTNSSQLLSQREKDILSALANGLTMKEIAQMFHLSPKTVETYRTRLSQKTGLNSIPELTQLAVRLGLC